MVKYISQIKNDLQSFFIYTISAQCNKIYRYLYNKAYYYIN